MPATYHLTEPFPAPSQQYAFTGRGGAGNVTRSRPVAKATEPATNGLYLVQSTQPYPSPRNLQTNKATIRKAYVSGRGGIGNLHPAAERAMFSFDEELERARKLESTLAPIYHIGRGGEGNMVHAGRDSGSASMRSGSVSSAESERGFKSNLEKVKNRFSKLNNSD
ncbi:MAG: hypothetical protein GOMPHAMPRED_008048 [Gomphillus americanus]|uniref:Uncharacterized protein n=1 Tax=Gomphillus americanus TaxID=1940652 RepID=A0A8H3EWR7_9LECA|nr:MAG: hypothetical protein GOMPHAMPRED_008048 [Gomphillus americanus]